MSEHGWPDDHHDDGFEHHDTHDDTYDAEPLAHDEPEPEPVPDEDAWQPPELDHGVPYEHQPEPQPVTVDAEAPPEVTAVGADPDILPDHDGDPASVFPPAVDVGELPEPVDGFPWIDTGSLGLADLQAAARDGVPDPAELAEYAGTELPPGADPWAALAESEDPATSALARFWGTSAGGPDQA